MYARTKYVLLLLGIVVLGVLLQEPLRDVLDIGLSQYPSWQERQASLEARYGLRISFDDVAFSPRFQGSQPQWTPVPEIQRARVLKYLAVDMAKYSPAFLHANLAHMYIIQTLTFHDRPSGGTVDDTVLAVYLTAPFLRDREREVPHRAGVFHHEFSSILYQRHRTQFPDKAWRRTNPAQFAYESAYSGRRNLYTKLSNTRFSPSLYDQGFVCFYGQTTLEDDFNTFAELFLAYPEEARAIAAKHPRMRQKLELIQGFYGAVGFVPPPPS